MSESQRARKSPPAFDDAPISGVVRRPPPIEHVEPFVKPRLWIACCSLAFVLASIFGTLALACGAFAIVNVCVPIAAITGLALVIADAQGKT
jgi:hypothetical protein